MKKVIIIIYGMLLSAFIGIIASTFLVIETWTSDLVWQQSRAIQIGAVVLGGVGLYWLVRRWSLMPQSAEKALANLKQHRFGDYRLVFVNLLITLIILTCGAGVGPEAALLSAVITLSSWQADKIRYLYFNYSAFQRLSWLTKFQRLAAFSTGLQTYDGHRAIKTPRFLRQKRLLYVMFGLNGLVAFAILMRHTDQPAFITKLGNSTWHANDWQVVLPLIMVAVIYGNLWRLGGNWFQRLIARYSIPLGVKILCGLIGILVISRFFPELLFSGQHEIHLLVGTWQQATPLFLSMMAVVKLLFLNWCLQTHWRGGDIFPVLFASLTQGLAISLLLPNYDHIVVMAVVATAMAGSLLDQPLIAGMMVALFCPLNVSPIVIVTVLVLMGIKRGVRQVKPLWQRLTGTQTDD